MSYTDFVAFVNQTNVPPGSYSTLTKWKTFSSIEENSFVFEAACTTGFSILNLAKETQCKGLGVDISLASVETARKNALAMNLSDKVTFTHSDATKVDFHGKISHLIVGAALRFFPDPDAMLQKAFTLFGDNGYILASPFYVNDEVPESMLKKAQKVFGIIPTTEKYKDVMKLYRGLDVMYEDRNEIYKETEEELHHYCESTLSRLKNTIELSDEEYNQAYKRLYDIKTMSNDLREFQEYSVLVLKYEKKNYPNRYTELF